MANIFHKLYFDLSKILFATLIQLKIAVTVNKSFFFIYQTNRSLIIGKSTFSNLNMVLGLTTVIK